MRAALAVPDQPGYKKLMTHVLSRDPASGGRRLRLDRGSRDGIRIGQAVLAGSYLLGRILEVSRHSAVVITVHDPNCKVVVQVVGRKAHGILFGAGEQRWKSQPYCLLKYLPRDLEYPAGTRVVSSAYSRMMPPAIPVGVVAPPVSGQMPTKVNRLYRNAWVKPKAFEQEYSILMVLVAE